MIAFFRLAEVVPLSRGPLLWSFSAATGGGSLIAFGFAGLLYLSGPPKKDAPPENDMQPYSCTSSRKINSGKVLIDKDIGGRGSGKLLFLLDLSRKVVKTLVLAADFGCSAPFSGQLRLILRYVGRDRRVGCDEFDRLDVVSDVILSRTLISVENSEK